MKRFELYQFQTSDALNAFEKQIKYELQNTFKTGQDVKLEDIHKYVDRNSINNLRLKCFASINKLEWQGILKKSIFARVRELLGPDLLIQKKLNLSIQMPNDKTSILPAHTDCNSGDSPFQLVVWIPLTNAFSTNSMFIFSRDQSKKYFECNRQSSEWNELAVADDFIKVNRGEYIVFPPTLIHGNQLNETERTRVSLNVRVKSLYSPYQPGTPADRTYGTYYSLWNLSEWAEWNNSVYQNLR